MASGDMPATAVPLEDLRQPIFVLLGVRALPQAAAVSRAWAAAGRDETLWWAWLQQFWDIDDLEGVAPGFSSAREVLQMACATAAWTKRAVPGELIPAIDDPRFITAWGDFCPEVQAFLFGISSGAMPTHDGLFTFHCRGATPVHYRHCGDPEGAEKATLAGRQLTGGTWKWSPDKVEWYPTTSQDMGMDVTNLANEGLELRDRDEPQNLRTTRMTRIFAETNKDGNEKQPPWWVAHPGNRRNVVWDVFGAMFVLYDCFVIPLRVFNPPVTPLWVLVEWLGIIYWTINIPVTLTLGYVVDGEAIMDPYSIFMHYLKTWFAVDAMVLPFDWTFAIMDIAESGAGTDGEVVKLLRILRLVRTARLIRLLKLKWILEAIDDAFESEMAGIWVKIFKMVLLLLAINHLIACVWFLLASTNPADDTWLVQEGYDTVNWDYQYATAFRWSITQFTPAGMEVQPHNMTERTFTIAVVVFALVGFSYVVGSITGSLAQLRSMSEHAVKEFWRLRLFLKRHKVPPPLALRIKRFVEFEFQRQQKMMPLETVGVLKLLSEQMMSELQAAINIPHMTVHPLFELLRDKSSLVMHRICNTALGHKQLAPGDILFMPGEQASCMYFLTTGRLWYRRLSVEPPNGEEIKDEPRGEWVEADEDWITEPGIWLAEWEHLGSATATRPSSVIKLRSENLYEVIKQCPPSFWRFLKEYATRFCNWLDNTDFEDLSDIFQGDKNSDLIQSFIPQQGEVKPPQKESPTSENFFGNRLRRMSHVFTARADD